MYVSRRSTATAKAVAESMGTTADGLLQTAKSFFSLLAPVISADSDGRPTQPAPGLENA